MKREMTDNRSLSEFIKAKLHINLKQFAEDQGISVRTYQDRWNSEQGKKHIINEIFMIYVKRFDDL